MECTICGLCMLWNGKTYYDGQLVACGDGHIAMVSHDGETDPYVGDAEPVSEWVFRLVHAFDDKERKDDVRTIASAVKALEEACEDEDVQIFHDRVHKDLRNARAARVIRVHRKGSE